MNTHILSDVEMVCDRVAIIVKGRIRYEGAIAGLPRRRRARGRRGAGQVPRPADRRELEEELGASCAAAASRIEVRVPEKYVGDLLRAALGAGAEVVSVTPHRASLESIFLSAVEKRNRTRRPGRGP